MIGADFFGIHVIGAALTVTRSGTRGGTGSSSSCSSTGGSTRRVIAVLVEYSVFRIRLERVSGTLRTIIIVVPP